MDNLGTTDTNYFSIEEPEERKLERDEQEGKIREGIRVLEEIIARFDERIALYDSINSIPDDIKSDERKLSIAIYAKDEIVGNLQAEKDYLESLRTTYK